jgi:hypothetical protein
MNITDTIAQARRFAEGDGVMINPRRAFDLLCPVKGSLQGEDLTLFQELEELFPDDAPLSSYGLLKSRADLSEVNLGVVSLAAKKPASLRTKEDVRALLDRTLEVASPAQVQQLYKAIEDIACKRGGRTAKPENIRFGNNLGFLLHQWDCNSGKFCLRMNTALKKHNLSISRQAVYYYVTGQTGIRPEVLDVLIDVVNSFDASTHHALKQLPITKEHLYLEFPDFIALFKNPKTDDEKVRKLLEGQQA